MSRSHSSAGVLVLILTAGIGGVVAIALQGDSRSEDPLTNVELSEVWRAVDALRADLDSVKNEVESLRDLGRGEARTPIGEPFPLADLESRLEALESAISSGVPSDGAQASVPQELPVNDQELRSRLYILHNPSRVRNDPNRAERVALLRQFLRLYPQHEETLVMMERLIREHLDSGDSGAALAAIEEFAPTLSVEPWERERLYAKVHNSRSDYAKLRETYQRIVTSSAPIATRAEAQFYYGYAYLKEGDFDRARTVFEEIIQTYKDSEDREIRPTVVGARNQLARITEWTEKK